MSVQLNTVLPGNTLHVLQELRGKGVKVHCIVTSPPYFQKRNYGTNPVVWDAPKEGCEHEWGEYLKRLHQGGGNSGVPEEWQRPSRKDNTGGNSGRFCKKCNAWEGELGLEPTVELFVEHLCQIFDVCKDVLRDDGNCFVNLDDTFKDKDMLMVPEEFARAMRKRGWILRRKIMWLKSNPMRRPDRDTFVHAWEYVYQFVKQQEYYFDTQYEPYSEATLAQFEKEYNGQGHKNYAAQGIQDPSEIKRRIIKSGKNAKGAIMTDIIVTAVSHWHGSHTATFPVELITPLISAACPEFICKKCGKPRERIYDEVKMPTRPGENISMDGKSRSEGDPYKEIHSSDWSILKPRIVRIETGLTSCECRRGVCKSCGVSISFNSKTKTISCDASGSKETEHLSPMSATVDRPNEAVQSVLQQPVSREVVNGSTQTARSSTIQGSDINNERVQGGLDAGSSERGGGIRVGTQADNGEAVGASPLKDGSGTSHQREHNGQQNRESTSDGQESSRPAIETTQTTHSELPMLQKQSEDQSSGRQTCPNCRSVVELDKHCGYEPGVVLDCFFGTGTSGEAAIKLRRRFIGIEINPVSVKESQERLDLLAEEFKKLGDNEKYGRQTGMFEMMKQAGLEEFS